MYDSKWILYAIAGFVGSVYLLGWLRAVAGGAEAGFLLLSGAFFVVVFVLPCGAAVHDCSRTGSRRR